MFSILKINELLQNLCCFTISGGMGGGGSSSTQEQTVTNTPWEGVQPYMKEVFSEAQSQFRSERPDFYSGQTFADMSPQTLAALQMQEQTALLNPTDQFAATELANTLTGQYLNAENPYLNRVVGDVTGDIGSQVASAFNQGGRYGSGSFMGTLAEQVGDAAANIRYQDYENERQNMQRALALAPQIQQMQYQDPLQLAQVGAAYENQAQKAINEEINRFNFYQNRDRQALADYNSLLAGGLGFGTQTGVQTTPTSGGNALSGAIGGGLLGYGAADAIPALSTYGLPLAAGGALLGALGLF